MSENRVYDFVSDVLKFFLGARQVKFYLDATLDPVYSDRSLARIVDPTVPLAVNLDLCSVSTAKQIVGHVSDHALALVVFFTRRHCAAFASASSAGSTTLLPSNRAVCRALP